MASALAAGSTTITHLTVFYLSEILSALLDSLSFFLIFSMSSYLKLQRFLVLGSEDDGRVKYIFPSTERQYV